METITRLHGDLSTIPYRWSLAVVSEGYLQKDLEAGVFLDDARAFVKELLSTPPFNDPSLNLLLNIVAVSVASNKSGEGIGLVPAVNPSGFDTAFGAMFGRETFGGQPIERVLYGNSQQVKDFVHAQPHLGPVEHFVVIVNNTTRHGGAMDGGVGWSSKHAEKWPAVVVHELGHEAFGLADEYAYTNSSKTDPVRAFQGYDPAAPNVTADIHSIKWKRLLTLPPLLVPTTLRSSTCERHHLTLQPRGPMPPDAVGAFEGARYHDCDIWRPAQNCKMRESARPFCRICEHHVRMELGHYQLKPGPPRVYPIGAWTHVQAVDRSTRIRDLLFYDTTTGAYALSPPSSLAFSPRRPDGTPPFYGDPALGTGNLGAGWTSLIPFTLREAPCYIAHRFGAGDQALFRHADWPSIRPTPTWASTGGPTWTHHAVLTVGFLPHLLSYNSFTGQASLFRIDSDAAEPVRTASMQWEPGCTAVVGLMVQGLPFVLTYQIGSGDVATRRIWSAGSEQPIRHPGLWSRNITHAAFVELRGRAFVVRYSALDGTASLDHVRNDAAGIDLECAIHPPPGIGGLSILGVGAPALDTFSLPRGNTPVDVLLDLRTERLFFYNALTRSLWVAELS